jgi:hypothetical protein
MQYMTVYVSVHVCVPRPRLGFRPRKRVSAPWKTVLRHTGLCISSCKKFDLTRCRWGYLTNIVGQTFWDGNFDKNP